MKKINSLIAVFVFAVFFFAFAVNANAHDTLVANIATLQQNVKLPIPDKRVFKKLLTDFYQGKKEIIDGRLRIFILATEDEKEIAGFMIHMESDTGRGPTWFAEADGSGIKYLPTDQRKNAGTIIAQYNLFETEELETRSNNVFSIQDRAYLLTRQEREKPKPKLN